MRATNLNQNVPIIQAQTLLSGVFITRIWRQWVLASIASDTFVMNVESLIIEDEEVYCIPCYEKLVPTIG